MHTHHIYKYISIYDLRVFLIYLYWNWLVLASSATYFVNDKFEINNGILFILRIS